jgi:hypothetical protein
MIKKESILTSMASRLLSSSFTYPDNSTEPLEEWMSLHRIEPHRSVWHNASKPQMPLWEVEVKCWWLKLLSATSPPIAFQLFYSRLSRCEERKKKDCGMINLQFHHRRNFNIFQRHAVRAWWVSAVHDNLTYFKFTPLVEDVGNLFCLVP